MPPEVLLQLLFGGYVGNDWSNVLAEEPRRLPQAQRFGASAVASNPPERSPIAAVYAGARRADSALDSERWRRAWEKVDSPEVQQYLNDYAELMYRGLQLGAPTVRPSPEKIYPAEMLSAAGDRTPMEWSAWRGYSNAMGGPILEELGFTEDKYGQPTRPPEGSHLGSGDYFNSGYESSIYRNRADELNSMRQRRDSISAAQTRRMNERIRSEVSARQATQDSIMAAQVAEWEARQKPVRTSGKILGLGDRILNALLPKARPGG